MRYLMKIFCSILLLIILGASGAAASESCFKCHDKASFSGRVVHSPVSKGNCGICHNPHAAKHKGLLQQRQPQLCFECHDFLEGNDVNKTNIHLPVRKGECTVCHDPHASKYRGLLKKQRGKNCFECHKDQPQKFKVTHEPYLKGHCGACHDPHQSGRIQLLVDDPEKLCLSCHKGELQAAHKGFPLKVGSCLTCHSPHGSKRASLIRDNLHAPFADGCNDCHDGNKVIGAEKCLECHPEVKAELNAVHNHLTSKKGNGCIACHSPHAADGKGLLRNRQAQVCRKCHADTFAGYVEKKYSHPDTGSCADCHALHGSNQLAMLRGDGNEVCGRCHSSQGSFTHPVGEGVYDPRTGLELNCVTCHYPHGTDFEFNLKLGGGKDLCVQCHRGY